jgi:hypothetical protein
MSSDFRKVIPYLVASVVHHSSWIAVNLHKDHPLFLSRCWRQGNQKSLLEFLLAPSNMFCSITGMQATGIPPLYVFMHNQTELNRNVVKALEKSQAVVPLPVKTPTGEKKRRRFVNFILLYLMLFY